MKLSDLIFFQVWGNQTSNTTQTQYANPSQLINYVSEWKKIIVGRNNQTVSQKFKIDNRIKEFYYFQVINKINQIINLDDNEQYEFYGSFIDAKGEMHTLFYSDDFAISQSNVLRFRVNTYTSEYLYYVKNPRQIDLTIKLKNGNGNFETVILRDTGIAYPTPIEPGMEPTPVIAGPGLQLNGFVMSLQNPVSGSFGAGTNISLGVDSPSFGFGQNLNANGNQLVIGRYNVPDTEAVFIVGNGNSLSSRNIFTIEYSGDVSGGTFYSNGVQVATLDDISGSTEYTAGEGIGISDQNVISLTATIPSSITQLNGNTYLIRTIYEQNSITANYWVSDPEGGCTWKVGIDYNSLHNAGFAYTSAIPLSTSQLVNDNGYISSILVDINEGSYSYRTSELLFGSDFKTNNEDTILLNYDYMSDKLQNRGFALTGQIPLSTSQLTNDSNYATSSYVQSVSGTITGWIDDQDYVTKTYVQNRVNVCPISNDIHIYTQNDNILSYYPNCNIYITKQAAYSDGKVYINALSTVPTNNTAITIEQHIYCYDYSQQVLFNGFVIDQNINVIGDLPSTFVAGTTYVFTRRLINISNNTREFISFAYSY